ncbi:MAG: hypothetical protein HWD63_01215 [Candidatus Parvibacillus calidus]|nr:MAG: hypothetical protein HWD63_01215 [Candidatus Parvibacillus calidus]
MQNVTGSGSAPNEFKDAPCLADGFTNSETNSTWFKWTCKDAGSLTFVLTPLNAPDDLDFALYELNGDLNTTNRTLLRCEAASCKGQTGLKEGATDISEPPNCDKGQDNWLAPVQLEAGKNYLLGINNFTIGGNGFRIEFGGTSTFEGPVADFEILSDTVFCREEQIGIKDLSHNSTGTIEKIQWIFGQDATPSIDSIQETKQFLT